MSQLTVVDESQTSHPKLPKSRSSASQKWRCLGTWPKSHDLLGEQTFLAGGNT